jgi:polar amino acid transport system substrate-binding protein
MRNRRQFLQGAGALSAAVLAGGLTACGTGSDSGSDSGGDATADGSNTLERLQAAGSITVGFAGEAPYSMEIDGELTGASVALHREIFGQLGIPEVNGVLTEWGSLIPGLNANRVDAIAAGMSILPDRCGQAAFSEPEFRYTTALMVPAGNPNGLVDLSSFEGTDLTLATMTGAIETDYAADLGIENIQVGGPQDGVDAVNGGRADAFALTGISLNYLANNSNIDVEVTESFEAVVDGVTQVGAGGTVFRQEDTSLRDAYNEVLAEIIADPDRYLGIVGEFGFTEAELPSEEMTAEVFCSGDLSSLQ